MWETPINRRYVRTGNWSISAVAGKEDAEKWSDVSVHDIAAGGLLFTSEMPYETGDLLRFDLLIDPMAPGIARRIPMNVKGKITEERSMRDGKRTYSVIFTEISRDDRVRLDELVRITNYKCMLDTGLDYLDH